MPSLGSVFRHRDFRLYQAARFLSIVGVQIQTVAVGWQVYEITRRPLDLGYVGLAQFIPFLLFSLIGGQAADRFDRRRILLICFFLQAACAGLLFAFAFWQLTDVRVIYACLMLFGAARAFSAPAASALVPHLVPMEFFENAVALGGSVRQIAVISGPAVGGLLYAAFARPAPVYAASAVASVAATVLVLLMAVRTGRMDKEAVSLRTVLAGIKFVWTKKLLLGSISLDLFAVLLGGAVALLPIYARDILEVGPWGLGFLRSAQALGAGAMSVVLSRRRLRKAGALMLWCVAAFGVATIVFGLSRNFALSLGALVILGATDMVSVVIRLTLEQIATPPPMRGRVGAVNMMFIGASNELGDFESGLTAAWWGVVPAVVVGGVGTCVVVLLWAVMFPEIRKIDRLESS